MTVALDRGIAALREEFAEEIDAGLIVHLGTTNCRRKNNTKHGPWSEHAWPNAVDVMLKRIPGTATPTPAAKAVGYRIAAWMRAHPELWSEVFWQVAAHFDHVHGTATPRRNPDNKQVPPCAGGPADPLEEDDMPTIEEIAAVVRQELEEQIPKIHSYAPGRMGSAYIVDARTKLNTDAILRKLGEPVDIDIAGLADALAEELGDAIDIAGLADALAEELGPDLGAEFAEVFGARLRGLG